jgi:glycine/D-amino acid oxidase-like deaminating enzyme
VFWTDRPDAPDRAQRLNGQKFADLQQCLVDPAKLVGGGGLTRLVLDLGGSIFEQSPVVDTDELDGRLSVATEMGSVRADRVIVATNAYPSPVRASRRRIIPVYDHVLMTEPLTDEQQASIGWSRWEGIDEAASQFRHTLRTADGRILWGGYDATSRARKLTGHLPSSSCRRSDSSRASTSPIAGVARSARRSASAVHGAAV